MEVVDDASRRLDDASNPDVTIGGNSALGVKSSSECCKEDTEGEDEDDEPAHDDELERKCDDRPDLLRDTEATSLFGEMAPSASGDDDDAESAFELLVVDGDAPEPSPNDRKLAKRL